MLRRRLNAVSGVIFRCTYTSRKEWCTLEYQHIGETVGASRAVFTRIPPNQLEELKGQLKGRLLLDSADSMQELNWDRVVLLDMDAEEELKVEDANKFDAVLVGGILGNVPSDDRTSEVRRKRIINSRHLGPLQMTTNTAVLVSKIVLEDKIPLEEIPLVDEPEIPASPNSKESIILPFRYVAKSYLTKSKHDENTPILPDGMLPFLLESGNASLF